MIPGGGKKVASDDHTSLENILGSAETSLVINESLNIKRLVPSLNSQSSSATTHTLISTHLVRRMVLYMVSRKYIKTVFLWDPFWPPIIRLVIN